LMRKWLFQEGRHFDFKLEAHSAREGLRSILHQRKRPISLLDSHYLIKKSRSAERFHTYIFRHVRTSKTLPIWCCTGPRSRDTLSDIRCAPSPRYFLCRQSVMIPASFRSVVTNGPRIRHPQQAPRLFQVGVVNFVPIQREEALRRECGCSGPQMNAWRWKMSGDRVYRY
jgi:hypothetical protein